jgi:sugar lactone lactonase YvrE
MVSIGWLAVLLACSSPPDDSTQRGPLASSTVPDPTGSTGSTDDGPVDSGTTFVVDTGAGGGTTTSTGSTGDSAVDTGLYAYDCSQPAPAIGQVNATSFVTEEDFDFAPAGFLVSQSWQNIEGLDAKGNVYIYAANVGSDPAGLRFLSTGDLAVAQPDLGGVLWIDAKTGAKNNIASGLTFPNALAADRSGYLYVTEYANNGRVMQIDPYTGDIWPVASNLDFPNGIELSPDEQRLYVSEAPWGGGGRIFVVPRLADTTWGVPELFFETNSSQFYTIGIDVCENLYVVDYSDGELYRISKDGVAEHLLDVDSWGSYSAMRFGNGVGGFERTDLYVTRRAELYRIPIGIPGKLPVYQ